jgi:hypothetical protein
VLTKLKDQIAALKDDLRDAGSADLRQRKTIAASDLPGVVVDDSEAQKVGMWKLSTIFGPFIGSGYVSDHNDGKGEKTISFAPKLPKTGRYEVRVAFNAGPWSCRASDGQHPACGRRGSEGFQDGHCRKAQGAAIRLSLGTYRFEANGQGFVLITNAGSEGYVTVDAVQFLPVGAVRCLTCRRERIDPKAAKLKTQPQPTSKSSSNSCKKTSPPVLRPCRWRKTKPEDAKHPHPWQRPQSRRSGAAWFHPGSP